MDLDKFKVYNDSFGHQQGDVALQTAGNVFARAVNRNNDFVARWGGEEFVVLLPNTESPGASAVAENIRRAVEGTEIPLGASMDEKAKHLTVSIGIKTQMPTQADTIENFIADADKALYKAKQTGRNKFVLFESE
jgi:diguanylate cyclase (GGDEF)-like protein